MRPSRRPLTAVAAIVLLAGCGSGGGSSPEAPDRLEPVAAVQAAASSSTEQSARLTLESTTDVAGQTVVLEGSGLVDPAAELADLTFTLPRLADGQAAEFSVRQVGDRVFLQLPQQGEAFYELSLEQLGGTSFGSAGDPLSSLGPLAQSTDVERVGEQDVDGVATTHYRGSYDLQAALGASTGQARTSLEALQQIGGEQLQEVPFEVFVDDEGRVRRFTQELDLPGSEATGGQAISSRTVLELGDYGVEVDVEPPPAEQVQPGDALLEMLGGAAVPPPAS